MKKNITIGIAIVVVLIAAIGAISFAAWDKTSDTITIGTINTPDNVELTVDTTHTVNKMNLVPKGAVKTAKEAEIVSLGSFRLALSSKGSSTQDELKAKVRMNWSGIDVTTSGEVSITQYLESLILVADEQGTIKIDNTSTTYSEITTDEELSAGVEYIVAMKFVDTYNNGEDDLDIKVVMNRAIKAVVNFNCVARP